ncbi:phage protein, HK97 gp10 family [Pilibacter termitis]|uniref:Phage protein, HK97 gp10 family n=1 Tax=Pilibacter termitis TaxID=263852 RepID=A0A1T4PF08_9ENTE|nr:HK97-gp10 family putative phage morphogenesis protein [Pilibacter termitis]SJZ89806.1 phage protein, HK97 gp10 family [Pilibacter termitis]
MSSGIELKGADEVIKQLEEKLGERKANSVANKALTKAAEVGEQKLKQAVSSFKRTGQTQTEITFKRSRKDSFGVHEASVGWGQGSRWRLEHLNEFGFTRGGIFTRPRGYGVVQNFYNEFKHEAKEIIANEIKKGLK